jgi:hypothetical protein
MVKAAKAARRKALVLSFDGSLYPLESVREAAAAFGQVARTRVTRKGRKAEVTLAPLEGAPEDEILAGEFGNYALGLAVAARRSEAE